MVDQPRRRLPLTTTRSHLVEAARQLFHAQGYEATSLAAIADRAGAKPGSLYYFFRTKLDLLVAVLERYRELLYPLVIEPAFRKSDDPLERILHVVSGYRDMSRLTEDAGGCPIGNLALEMADASPAVHAGIVANFDAWCAAIEGCLEEAGDRLPASVDRARLARFVLTVMEGAVLQARGRRSVVPIDEAVEQIRELLDTYESAGRTARTIRDKRAPGVRRVLSEEEDR